MLKLGSQTIENVYKGSSSIGQAYLGPTLVYQKGNGAEIEDGTLSHPYKWLKEVDPNYGNNCHTKSKSTDGMSEYRIYYLAYLTAGVQYSIGQSGSGDTYLRVLTAENTQVAYNDDREESVDGAGVDSYLTYTPQTTGWYKICLGCYNDSNSMTTAGHCYPAPTSGIDATDPVYVHGTEADLMSMTGTYTLNGDMLNDRPVYYCASQGKYLFACEENAGGSYAWVISTTPVQKASSLIAMGYSVYTASSASLANAPTGQVYKTSGYTDLSSSEFEVTDQNPFLATLYVYGSTAESLNLDGTYQETMSQCNGKPVYYCSTRGKYLFLTSEGYEKAWVISSTVTSYYDSNIDSAFPVYTYPSSSPSSTPVGQTYYRYDSSMSAMAFTVSLSAPSLPEPGPDTVYVYGTVASSEGVSGTYTRQSTIINGHYVYYCSDRSKYLYVVEDGMDPGKYAWVILSNTSYTSYSDPGWDLAISTQTGGNISQDPTEYTYRNYGSTMSGAQCTVSTTPQSVTPSGTSYTVTVGGGMNSSYAGTYTDTGDTFNGFPVYSNGSRYLASDGSSGNIWNLYSSTGGFGFMPDYQETSATQNTQGPEGRYESVGGGTGEYAIVTAAGGGNNPTPGPDTVYVYGTEASQNGYAGTYTRQNNLINGHYVYYSSSINKYIHAVEDSEDPGKYSWVFSSSTLTLSMSDVASQAEFASSSSSSLSQDPTSVSYMNYGSGLTSSEFTVSTTQGGGGNTPSYTETLYVTGSDAVSLGMDGTYVLQSTTLNDRPVYYCSARSKYMYAVEDESDPGKYAWAISPSTASSVGMLGMAYYSYAFTSTSGALATEPTGLTFYKESVTAMSQSTFAVTDTDPNSGGGGSGSSTSYQATGGAESSVNGTYTDTGNTYNGQPVYSNGTFYLWYDGAYWCLNTSSQGGAGSMPSYTHSGTIEGTYNVAMGGTSPCPTISVVSSTPTPSGTSYIATGCSTSAVNGTYTDTGSTYNSQPVYGNGNGYYILYGGSSWEIWDDMESHGMPNWDHSTITGTWNSNISDTPPTITESGGGGGNTPTPSDPSTIWIVGTEATTMSMTGEYTKQNNTINNRPVYYSSSTGKYLFAVEDGSNGGNYAWVVASATETTCYGMIGMSYSAYTNTSSSLASNPVGLTFMHSGYTSMSSSEFDVTDTDPGGGNTPTPSNQLVSSYTVTVADGLDSSWGGTYTQTGSTLNSQPIYSNGTRYLAADSSAGTSWSLYYDQEGMAHQPDYQETSATQSTFGPEGRYESLFGGTGYATITAGSSGGGNGGNQSGEVPDPVYIYGDEAETLSYDGTYVKQNSTNNSRATYYCSNRNKYLFAVEDGTDSGKYAWAIGSSVQQIAYNGLSSDYNAYSAKSSSLANSPTELDYYINGVAKDWEDFEVTDGDIGEIYPDKLYVTGHPTSGMNGEYTQTNDVEPSSGIPIYSNGTYYITSDGNRNWYFCDSTSIANVIAGNANFSNLTPSSQYNTSTSQGYEPSQCGWTTPIEINIYPSLTSTENIVMFAQNYKGETFSHTLTDNNGHVLRISRATKYGDVSITENTFSNISIYKGTVLEGIPVYVVKGLPNGNYSLYTNWVYARDIQGSGGSLRTNELTSQGATSVEFTLIDSDNSRSNGYERYQYSIPLNGAKKYIVVNTDKPWPSWWKPLIFAQPNTGTMTFQCGGSWILIRINVSLPTGYVTDFGTWFGSMNYGVQSIYVTPNDVSVGFEGLPYYFRVSGQNGGTAVLPGQASITIDSGSYGNVTENGNTIVSFDEYVSSGSFSISANNSYNVYTDPLCLVEGTTVKLADGSYKDVADITYDDELLVWNFDEGKYDKAKPIWIKADQQTPNHIVTTFDDGSVFRSTGDPKFGHRVFSLTKNKFDYVTNCVGDDVVTIHGIKKIVSTQLITKTMVNLYNIITEHHFNLYADDILTSCSLNNMYEFKDMKFVKVERECVTNLEGIPDELIEGLRLREQPTDVHFYVLRLMRAMKPKE